MFQPDDIARARSAAEETTGQALSCSIEVQYAQGLELHLDKGHARISAEDRNALARAFFLLCRTQKENLPTLHIRQTRHFRSCGLMLDASRNAVMKVDSVKRLIRIMASLGMNLLLLYTEDTYEVPELPRLGYLRGRYTQQELRELDDYAAALDVELMPCIQTLGHMEQFLQWNDSSSVKDTESVLLADHEETYTMIRQCVAALRACFRTRRIHVGMDEAHDVGRGRYYDVIGHEPDRFALLTRHLRRVTDICLEYDFKPMMWNDMFFRLGSSTGDYYDMDAVIPDSAVQNLPEADTVYWDYYHEDADVYRHFLRESARLGQNTIFAGGIWTWLGFLPHARRTNVTMRPAMQACLEHQVQTVFSTMWGDDGAETNFMLALNQLPLFSESCWLGQVPSEEEVACCGELVTGIPAEAFQAFSRFYPNDDIHCTGKGLIWCDPLYPLMNYGFEPLPEAVLRFRSAAQTLRQWPDRLDCRYAACCMEVAADKGDVIYQLREKYLLKDHAYLRHVAEEIIPRLLEKYAVLMQTHRALWERDMKRFGWEVLCLRYGGVSARLMDAQDEIRRYLDGVIPSIPELEEEPMPPFRSTGQHFHSFATPMKRL